MDTDEDIATAEAQGWQRDFSGENKKTAKEYLHDGQFFKKIDEKNSRIEQLETAISTLNEHNDKVRINERKKLESEYKNIIEDLKNEKVVALDEGDNRRVVEIDEQIRTTEKPQPDVQNNREFENWITDNSWYDNNKFLRIEADKVGEFYYQSGLRGRGLFDAIGEHVQELHPEKFANQKRSKAATVEGGTSEPIAKGAKVSEKDLTTDERTVFHNFKHMKIFKDDAAVQKYLREVIEVR